MCTPGASHAPSKAKRDNREYWLFQAASDGCLPCVKHFLDVENVDPSAMSATQRYTALDFASYAHSRGVAGADAVAEFLRARQRADGDGGAGPSGGDSGYIAAAPLPADAPPPCLPGASHPPSKKRRGSRVCWMYQAAAEGCKTCVQYYVDVEAVDPRTRSDNMGYTALDWAVWAASRGVDGASGVAEFLRERAPELSEPPEKRRSAEAPPPDAAAQKRLPGKRSTIEAVAREAGLSTPLPDNVGARMMAQMGWVPGQALGPHSDAGALVEPLRPDTSRLDEQRHGVGYLSEL